MTVGYEGPDFLLAPEPQWEDCVQQNAEQTENDPEVKREPKSLTVLVKKYIQV